MLIFAHVNSNKSTNDMDKFRKLIAIEPVSMTAEAQARLKAYADVTEMSRTFRRDKTRLQGA